MMMKKKAEKKISMSKIGNVRNIQLYPHTGGLLFLFFFFFDELFYVHRGSHMQRIFYKVLFYTQSHSLKKNKRKNGKKILIKKIN